MALGINKILEAQKLSPSGHTWQRRKLSHGALLLMELEPGGEALSREDYDGLIKLQTFSFAPARAINVPRRRRYMKPRSSIARSSLLRSSITRSPLHRLRRRVIKLKTWRWRQGRASFAEINSRGLLQSFWAKRKQRRPAPRWFRSRISCCHREEMTKWRDDLIHRYGFLHGLERSSTSHRWIEVSSACDWTRRGGGETNWRVRHPWRRDAQIGIDEFVTDGTRLNHREVAIAAPSHLHKPKDQTRALWESKAKLSRSFKKASNFPLTKVVYWWRNKMTLLIFFFWVDLGFFQTWFVLKIVLFGPLLLAPTVWSNNGVYAGSFSWINTIKESKEDE